MEIVINNRDEVKILQKIKEIYSNLIITNNICEFKPIKKDIINQVCDFCQHNYYNDEGYEGCKIQDEIL